MRFGPASRALAVGALATAMIGGIASPTLASARWRIVPSPPGPGTLSAVSAISKTDAWAVGVIGTGTAARSLVTHWDGTSWTTVPTPNPGGGGFYDVLALASNDVWAVGSNYYPGDVIKTLTEHWDGTAWKVVPSPTPKGNDELYRVVGTPGGPLWAFGVIITDMGATFHGLTERWNGSKWEVIQAPDRGLDTFLWGAAMAPNGDAWALGWSDSLHRSGGQTLAARWDGTAWEILKTPNHPRDCFCAFLGGAASSGSDVWAVGNNGYHSLIEHWDGATWSFVPTPTVGSGSALNGAVALAGDSAWVAGFFDDSGSRLRTLTEHWNGTKWSVISSPSVGDESFLQGIAAVPGTAELWAVGDSKTGDTDSPLIELFS